jgi:hypothetical protein
MKMFSAILLLASLPAMAGKDVHQFHEKLFEGVKTDVEKQNDEAFKPRKASRGPASVAPAEPAVHPEEKRINKTIPQMGSNKW